MWHQVREWVWFRVGCVRCCFAVAKKQRMEGEGEGACPLVCLSPNACCVFVVRAQCLQLYQIVRPLLGLKGVYHPLTSAPHTLSLSSPSLTPSLLL